MASLLFQNEACMVINKNPGESSESPGIGPAGEFFTPVHRLDTPVSGCLLLARTQAAAAFLGGAFARHDDRVEKRYWAIIEKPQTENMVSSEGELVHLLSFDRKKNKSFAFPFGEAGKTPSAGRRARFKKAILRYRIAGQGERYVFLEIDLVTGRHHQIRAQLAALGLYIKGDLKYGARRSEKSGGIRLHAWFLAFPNPVKPNEIIRVQAPPPMMDSLWSAFAEAVIP